MGTVPPTGLGQGAATGGITGGSAGWGWAEEHAPVADLEDEEEEHVQQREVGGRQGAEGGGRGSNQSPLIRSWKGLGVVGGHLPYALMGVRGK